MKQHRTVSRIVVHMGSGFEALRTFLTEQQDNVLDYSLGFDGSYAKWVARTIVHERIQTVPSGIEP